jgi:potassium channel subfamily K
MSLHRYVSLLTIGYGDLAPRSSAGKPFFVIWSIIAIPVMSILVSDLGDTLIHSFTQATHKLGDYTLLPKAGLWRTFLERNPWLLLWVQSYTGKKAAKKRIEEGFQVEETDGYHIPTLEELAEGEPSDHDLARKLAAAIRHVANDLHKSPPIMYSYNEWANYLSLIRFTKLEDHEKGEDGDPGGLVEWDWIGEDSPMLADQSESEWVLDRLTESLDRYVRKQIPREDRKMSINQLANKAAAERAKKDSFSIQRSPRAQAVRYSDEVGPDEVV